MSYNFDAIVNYGVGPEPANWNIHSAASASSYSTLSQVLAQVWPSAFEVGPSGSAVLNSSLLVSAELTNDNPQTVVYQINPRAIWSDGSPITYRDFAYNWQAQSGKRAFRDAGGQVFTPLATAGYDDITSVRGDPASVFVATVTFSKPYPDWRSLFSYLVPAHVAMSLGFDRGFTDPVKDLVSGGPFVVSELQQGYSLELVRNARYWGLPANLSGVTYYFLGSQAQTVDALAAGELQVAALPVEPSDWEQLQAAPNLSVQAVASSMYEDLDFNESSGPFRSAVLRHAVMLSMDRVSIAGTVLGPYGLAPKPVENRAFLQGAPSYSANGVAFDNGGPSSALSLLEGAGYSIEHGALVSPTGAAVAVSLAVSTSDTVAAEIAPEVQQACAAIGMKVTVVPESEASLAPGWAMAIEERQVPQWPSQLAARYVTGGADNVDRYSGTRMDQLLSSVGDATSSPSAVIFDQVDELAWNDFVDLPLVAVPVAFATGGGLLNLEPGPYYANLAWDEQEWGFAG